MVKMPSGSTSGYVGRHTEPSIACPSPLGRATSSTTVHATASTPSPVLTSAQNIGKCRGERRSTRAASGRVTRPMPKKTTMKGPISVLAAWT
jgi:hypothetical protein